MTILLDSCSGNHKERNRPFFHRRKWAWLETLHAAGVAPEHVDLARISHRAERFGQRASALVGA
jgi:hypothetical protein